MKLLIDNQLPAALARYFDANGWECQHVRDIGLDAARDRAIWQYARERGLVIVTKDEDFKFFRTSRAVARLRSSGCASAIAGRARCWKRLHR